MITRRFILQASIASVAAAVLPTNEPVIEHEVTETHILPAERDDHPLDPSDTPIVSYKTDYDLRAGDTVVFHSRHYDFQWHWVVTQYYPSGSLITLAPYEGSNMLMTITGGTA